MSFYTKVRNKMKIGNMAAKYNVSKDTIRYYVEKGLLVPVKKGAQLDFGERECEDMTFLQKMKQMKFNIKEMQAVFTLRRLSNFIEPDTIKAYEDILNQKKENLSQDISLLQNAYQIVETELLTYQSAKYQKCKPLGVPLQAIPLLCCPKCGKQLKIQNAQIVYQYVESGELNCDCGYHAQIQEGIVDTGNRYQGQYDRPDLKRGLYRDVGEEFITGFQKTSDFVWNRLQEMGMKGKIIMETNINGYFFLYNRIKNVEKDCLYIITDRYPEMLRMYKQLIELLNLDLNILFIADDSEAFPLKNGCVDILLDYYGSNEQVLYKKVSFIQEYQRYLSEDADILGALFGFEANSISARQVSKFYPECSDIALNVKEMLRTYEKEGYETRSEQISEMLHTYNKYSFACHKEGEKLIIYVYEANRN